MAKKPRGLGKGLSAIFMENESEDQNSTVLLKISEIEPNKSQPRKDFDEEALEELANSISMHGILQPLLVRPILGGGYELVAGERRYRACHIAGVTEVPVVIRQLTDSQTMELALIENLQRENLTPVEEAYGYKTLIDEYNFSQEDVSESVGKSRPAVANALRLLNLPKKIIDMISNDEISAGHGRALLALEDEDQMIKLAKEIISKKLSVRQVENIIKKEKRKQNKESKTLIVEKDKYYSEVELALTEYLGSKVLIEPLKNKKGGTLQIEFYSKEDLQHIANKLEDKSQ